MTPLFVSIRWTINAICHHCGGCNGIVWILKNKACNVAGAIEIQGSAAEVPYIFSTNGDRNTIHGREHVQPLVQTRFGLHIVVERHSETRVVDEDCKANAGILRTRVKNTSKFCSRCVADFKLHRFVSIKVTIARGQSPREKHEEGDGGAENGGNGDRHVDEMCYIHSRFAKVLSQRVGRQSALCAHDADLSI